MNGDIMNALVFKDGMVLYIPGMRLKATCSIDMTNFPRDTQICFFKFGSWTYDGFKVMFLHLLTDSVKSFNQL